MRSHHNIHSTNKTVALIKGSLSGWLLRGVCHKPRRKGLGSPVALENEPPRQGLPDLAWTCPMGWFLVGGERLRASLGIARGGYGGCKPRGVIGVRCRTETEAGCWCLCEIGGRWSSGTVLGASPPLDRIVT